MSTDVLSIAAEYWPTVASFLNSNFTAALAGALGGALAAQRIGDRAKQRDEILHEIRSTNAAIVMAFAIFNAGLSLKRQYIKDLYETYTAKKEELKKFQERRAAGLQDPNLPFSLQTDFRSLHMPVVPIDLLRNVMFESISATGRTLTAVTTLDSVIAELSNIIQKRNDLIERFRQIDPTQNDLIPSLYFGLPYAEGHLSTEYPDTVEALYRLTDDIIFFSELMCNDLMSHGNRILDQYKKIAKIKKENIRTIDFTGAHREGNMPNAADYSDWLKGFPDLG